MIAPSLPLIAHDLPRAEAPIICWLFVAIVFMLIAVARFGWGGANQVLSRYRIWWGVSLAGAAVAAILLGVVSDQPLPLYF